MSKLQLILPNKEVRYVTDISDNDVTYSIYNVNALPFNTENFMKAEQALLFANVSHLVELTQGE